LSTSPLPAVVVGGESSPAYWHQLEHASNSAWFIIRSIDVIGGDPRTLMFAFEADVVSHLTACRGLRVSMLVIPPDPYLERDKLGAISVAEIWLAEDRYAKDEPCILFLGSDGHQYSGRQCVHREGLRRIQLIATLDV